MSVIFKYPLLFPGETRLVTTTGAQALTVQLQDDRLCVWMLLDRNRPRESREFFVVGTGFDFNPSGLKYLATIQDGSLVWHVFERSEPRWKEEAPIK